MIQNNPITVIIADDESAIRNGLETIVSAKQFGTRVLATADNGKDALILIKQHQPDIAIIDINMPEMDGLEVIRHSYEANCKTRFLILSGYSEFSYAQKSIRYGVKSYFLKPLNILEFREEFSKQCQEILASQYAVGEFSTQKLSSLVNSSRILFLNQLIQNKFHRLEDLESKLSVLNISISNINSFVTLFSLHSDSVGEVLMLPEIDVKYIQTSFENYAMESLSYDDNQIIAIFNLDDNMDTEFRTTLQHCIDLIKTETEYKITVGIGNVVPNLNQCFHSYLQAQEALSYHIYETGTDIYDSSLICDKKPLFSAENINYSPLVFCITHNDVLGIVDYCNSFFTSLFFVHMPPPNFIVGMCMYLIMNVQNHIILQYPDKKIEFESNFKEISAFESVQILKEWLINFFIHYCEMLQNTISGSNPIIEISKEFIQNNLHLNIKAKDVAARINLSESYFPIYFKDKTGINFRDYILQSRIEYAKKLLKTKKDSISEIAYLTGYQDYRSFSRAFKNETGMSPSDYSNYSE